MDCEPSALAAGFEGLVQHNTETTLIQEFRRDICIGQTVSNCERLTSTPASRDDGSLIRLPQLYGDLQTDTQQTNQSSMSKLFANLPRLFSGTSGVIIEHGDVTHFAPRTGL